jgi:hypothetical protein
MKQRLKRKQKDQDREIEGDRGGECMEYGIRRSKRRVSVVNFRLL